MVSMVRLACVGLIFPVLYVFGVVLVGFDLVLSGFMTRFLMAVACIVL